MFKRSQSHQRLADADVVFIYRTLLGRSPGEGEIARQRESAGWRELIEMVIASPEYRGRTDAAPTLPLPPAVNVWHPDLAEHGLAVGTRSSDGSVVVGRDGWLFLIGGTNAVLAQYSPDFELSDDWGQAWAEVIEDREAGARSIGAELAMVVVPDKLSVLREFLPAGLGELSNQSPASRLHAAHPKLRYPVAELAGCGDHGFLRTDTHLSLAGNAVLGEVVLADLGIDQRSAGEVRRSARSKIAMSGDLGTRFSPAVVEVAEVETSFGQATVVEDNRSQVAALGRHVGTRRIWRNPQAPDRRTAVVFGDSYAFAEPHYPGLCWHLAQRFGQVHFVWVPFGWDLEYARSAEASVVVCETAERFVPRPPAAISVAEIVRSAVIP